MNVTIETVCQAIETGWRCADKHQSPDMRVHCWTSIRGEIDGIENLLICGDLALYKELRDDLRFIWSVVGPRMDIALEELSRAQPDAFQLPAYLGRQAL